MKSYEKDIFLSIIIPTYNEEKVIVNTLTKIVEFLNKEDYFWEIIVSDDGSTDNTVQSVEKFPVKVVLSKRNKGKGFALRKAFAVAKGEWQLFLDADYSTKIEELRVFLGYIDEYDIIIGSRAIKGSIIEQKQPLYKVLVGKLGNKIIKIVLVRQINDTQCGFKMFNKKAAKLLASTTIDGWGFDFELLFLAQKLGYKIKELPIVWNNNSISRVKTVHYIKTLKEVFVVKINWFKGRYGRLLETKMD